MLMGDKGSPRTQTLYLSVGFIFYNSGFKIYNSFFYNSKIIPLAAILCVNIHNVLGHRFWSGHRKSILNQSFVLFICDL